LDLRLTIRMTEAPEAEPLCPIESGGVSTGAEVRRGNRRAERMVET